VAPDEIDASDPNFYSKMARFGASKSSEYYVQTSLEAAADGARVNARKTAEQEVAGGNGFVPVRNCANLTTQQRGFDLEQKRLSDLVAQDKEVLARLSAQYQLTPTSQVQTDIQKAAQQLSADLAKLKALPKSSKAFTQPCEAIMKPAKAVSDYTTAFIGAQLNAAAMPQDNNLPFGAALAEGWANSFLGNIITNKKVVNMLFENGYQSGNINPATVSTPAL
jgi:hypothetical protein